MELKQTHTLKPLSTLVASIFVVSTVQSSILSMPVSQTRHKYSAFVSFYKWNCESTRVVLDVKLKRFRCCCSSSMHGDVVHNYNLSLKCDVRGETLLNACEMSTLTSLPWVVSVLVTCGEKQWLSYFCSCYTSTNFDTMLSIAVEAETMLLARSKTVATRAFVSFEHHWVAFYFIIVRPSACLLVCLSASFSCGRYYQRQRQHTIREREVHPKTCIYIHGYCVGRQDSQNISVCWRTL